MNQIIKTPVYIVDLVKDLSNNMTDRRMNF